MTLLALVTACTPPAPDEVPEAPLVPDIQVTPSPVVVSGRLSDDAATETVTVANRGSAALEIRDIAWVDPAPAFFVSNIGAILVPPGAAERGRSTACDGPPADALEYLRGCRM